MSKLKALPLIITLFSAMIWLNGCVLLPIPTGERKVLEGKRVTQEQMAFLTPNVTTKKEVIDRLGSPDVIWEDARVFVYQWVMRWGFLFCAVGGYTTGGAGIEDIPKKYGLLIQFDEQDRLRRFEKVVFPAFKSYGDFLKEWVGNFDKTSPPSGGDRKE